MALRLKLHTPNPSIESATTKVNFLTIPKPLKMP